MIHCKKFMKIIAVSVIITFIFQGDIFLYSQGEDGLDDLFNKARNEYINGQYVTSKKRIEGIIGEIKENVLDRKDILGKCYLLLGAIYEKEEKTNLARENYRKAIRDYKVQSIDGIDFIGLITLDQVIKEPIEQIDRVEGEIDKKFIRARDEYVDGKHINSINRLERIIGTINEKSLDRDDILGKCYLLLGAIYEKENKELLAQENYQKAKEKYNIQSIDGVDLENLTIYKEVIKGVKGRIEKEGIRRKKKFPWLLVTGGVVVVVVAAILLLKKKKYTLKVTRGEGVDGNPTSGTYKYKKGKYVDYSYTAQSGYTNLVVTLDGAEVNPGGSFQMNRDHTLTATATRGYTLTVTKGTGVDGTPESGTTTHAEGSKVDYSYSLRSGYSNLVVTKDGEEIPSSGTIIMNDNHTLEANATANVVKFVTDTKKVYIDEGDTSTFNVRLSTQPPGDVSVTVSRMSGGDEDIRVLSGGNLTFSTSNWDKYQEVTLEAVEDDDAENGEAKIRISASGIEPETITAAEVDNDTLNFVTDTDEVSIAEGSTNTFQVKLSLQPSSTVEAIISRVSGDNDISVSAGSKSLTFTPSNWNTYQEVKLEAAEDDDTVNGEATIRISASGIPNKDINATEVDNDTPNFVTDTDEVSIDEGSTGDFQVRLSSRPSSDVTASISRVSGDGDISVSSGSNLTFTPSNWNTYQRVTLRAADDSDTKNGQAIIRISASGIPNKDITATEVDNDSLSFVTDKNEVSVPEGRPATFKVKLSAEPSSNVISSVSFIKQKKSVNYRAEISPNSSSDVVAKVERVSGDKDISVTSGSSLTFDSTNWNAYQEVKLAAAEDDDTVNGKATIRISANGINDKDITVAEIDNDTLNFVTDKDEVSIDEEGTATFQVKLSFQPSSNVAASINRVSGDEDISVTDGSSLNFTPSNWNTYQTVTLEAAEDDDEENGEATIRISASGIPDKNITAKEIDNDIPNFITDTEDDKISVPEGGTAAFQVKLSREPSSEVTASISRVSGDSEISVTAGSSLIFTPSNWDTYQEVTLAAAEDDDTEKGEATIRISAPGTGIPDKDITATEKENDNSFVTDTEEDKISVPENGTAAFQVKLSIEPASDVVTSISRISGDSDISVSSGSSLTFTPSNWDTYQEVTLAAAEDDDTEKGEATIRISAPGTEIPDKDITATEKENDNSFVTDTEEDKISVPENGTAAFQVKLSIEPSSDVVTSISRVSGDSDISVISGSSLTFTPSNWDTYQEVTLAAAEDDDADDSVATIGISAFGIPDKSITATEVDNESPGNLSVTPDEEFSSSGSAGGPFYPPDKVYTLKNTGDTTINYTISKSENWLTLSSTGGTLAGGESVIVTVTINETANGLPQNTYTDTITFTNTTNHNGDTTQSVTLNVTGG